MNRKRASPRRLKANLTYTVAELSERLGVHRGTVRNWYRSGLEPIDDRKPLVFHGSEVKAFLAERSKRAKRSCADSELYCLSCRVPRQPAEGIVEWRANPCGTQTLSALCAHCETLMYRFVADRDVERIRSVQAANEKLQADACADPPPPPAIATSERRP